ncbi:MAG: methyltransferase domain-containing protein [Candidatus Dadabacteria bacterium]|nr:methyltransferase domain-containing protein [Candidatus Dadabacteria bacterium]NIT13122.1 methyltransferase domain-containing protein [Candidatus Dadabacteria bacterium]
MSRGERDQENSPDRDYSFGYKEGVLDYMNYRALKSFEFVLPYLQPGMDVLECGSGPGVVTLEIAKKVNRGSVIGIDINEDLIDSNNKKARDSNVINLKFEVASILELPYPNDSFDIVYMQALIVHMKDPNKAMKEV